MNKEICECPNCRQLPKGEWRVLKNLNGKIEYSYSLRCCFCSAFSYIPPAESADIALSRWNIQVLHKILSKYGGDGKIKDFICPACGCEVDYRWVEDFSDSMGIGFGSAIILYCANPECKFEKPFHLQEFSGLLTEWNQLTECVKNGIERGFVNYSKRRQE